jgi:hypothetical protein
LVVCPECGHELVQAFAWDTTKSTDGDRLDYTGGHEAIHRCTPDPQTLGSFFDGKKYGVAGSR